jgi:outer membrane protein
MAGRPLAPLARIAASAALALGLAAMPASAQTLADALAAAYRNSNLLEQNRALLRAADEDVAQAVATLRPVVSFVAQAERRWITDGRPATATQPARRVTIEDLTAQVALSADLTVYDFGRGRLAVDAARETVLATREALRGVEQQVLLNAVFAYMSLRNATEFLSLRQSNVRLIEQELRAARDRFEVGEITRTDVAIAEARLAAARSNLAAAEGDLAVAREAYRAATGTTPGQLAPPSRLPQTAPSLEAAREIALRTHPTILQAQRQVTVAELLARRAEAGYRGTLSAGARISQSDAGVSAQSLSLTFSQPIYTGGRISSLYRQALARVDASRAAVHQAVVVVTRDVGQAWAELAVALARIEATERQIAAARTAYEGVREEATLGARTTLDVLNAEQELLDARVARVAAETNRYLAVYQLLAAMGLLTVDHLGLGIPTYDPQAYYDAVRSAPVTTPQGQRLDRILSALGRN